MSQELPVVQRTMLHRRQNSAPCPRGNGTTIGTFQQFTVLCNTNLEGDVLDRLDAFDFTACADLCSSFHPRCEGASFNGSLCTLRARLQPGGQRPSRRSDSVIGTFPGASSNCATLGGTQQALGTSFTTMCGFIIAGNDISQNFAPTFQDCLGQCASTSGCAAVSFDASQDLGFKNCYLKMAVANPGDIAADRRTDSAVIAAAAAPVISSSESSVSASTGTGPGVSTVPVPSPLPGGSGAVFFTPPSGDSATSAPTASTPLPAPDSSALTSTATDLTTTESSTLAVGSLPFAFPTPSIATTPGIPSVEAGADAAGQKASDAGPSMAWVAAPVVGSVAAIALIAVSFVLVRRRRRGNGEKRLVGSRSSPFWNTIAGWLPALWSTSPTRVESRGSGRKMTGMGNFAGVESGRRSVEVKGGGVRSSVVGFMSGRPMGMERLEDIEEGEGRGETAELRRSFNGLGQNKWAQ